MLEGEYTQYREGDNIRRGVHTRTVQRCLPTRIGVHDWEIECTWDL